MRIDFAGYYLVFALAFTPALADGRPRESHIGEVYVNNRFAYTLGEFWDRKDCEFVGRGIKQVAMNKLFRPYDTTPEQALELITVEVKCRKAGL